MTNTVADLLAWHLRAAGVRRVFGAAVAGLDHVPVADDELAALVADASGHTGTAPGVALLSDMRLRVSSRPGGTADPITVSDATHLARAVASACALAGGAVPATAELKLDLDLDAPDDQPNSIVRTTEVGESTLPDPAGSVAVLAGPGVVRTGYLDGVRAFAASAGLGVANTWGAKGLFPWDSPHHLGTCGLQADDFALLGFGEVELIVATGLDPDEAPQPLWALAPHVTVAPAHLTALAQRWRRSAPAGPPNLLYPRLAAVVQRLSPSTRVPLSPARAVVDLRAALPPTGLLAADPGIAGLWVARTFPTTIAGSIGVPATVAPGYAAAAALVARLDGRPAVAVTMAPIERMSTRVLELALSLGIGFPFEMWAEDGMLSAADDHLDALEAAIDDYARVTLLTVPVDATQTEELVAVAGDVVAWGGLPPSAGA